MMLMIIINYKMFNSITWPVIIVIVVVVSAVQLNLLWRPVANTNFTEPNAHNGLVGRLVGKSIEDEVSKPCLCVQPCVFCVCVWMCLLWKRC